MKNEKYSWQSTKLIFRIVASWENPPNWKVICNLMFFFSKKEIKRITQIELETKLNLELQHCQKKNEKTAKSINRTISQKWKWTQIIYIYIWCLLKNARESCHKTFDGFVNIVSSNSTWDFNDESNYFKSSEA